MSDEHFITTTKIGHELLRHLRRLGDDDDDDDVVPPWVAFTLGGALLAPGFLATFWILRISPKSRNRESLEPRWWMSFAEVFSCLSINLLFLGGVQKNFDVASIMVLVVVAYICWPFFLVVLSLFTCHDSDPAQCWTGKDVFTNLGNSMTNVILLVLGQCLLLSIYLWGVYEHGAPDFSDHRVYVYYWLGMVVQSTYIIGKGVVKPMDWQGPFAVAKRGIGYEYQSRHGLRRVKPTLPSLIARSLSDVLVNYAGFWFILILLPVQLASSENPTDFVLNAIAAFYIIELDDEDEVEFLLVEDDDDGAGTTTIRLPLSLEGEAEQNRYIVNNSSQGEQQGAPNFLVIQLNNSSDGIREFQVVPAVVDQGNDDEAHNISVHLPLTRQRRGRYIFRDSQEEEGSAPHSLMIQVGQASVFSVSLDPDKTYLEPNHQNIVCIPLTLPNESDQYDLQTNSLQGQQDAPCSLKLEMDFTGKLIRKVQLVENYTAKIALPLSLQSMNQGHPYFSGISGPDAESASHSFVVHLSRDGKIQETRVVRRAVEKGSLSSPHAEGE